MVKLEDIIPVYILTDVILYIIYFLAFTVFVLFVTLIIHKLRTERREEEKEKNIARYGGLLGKYLVNKDIRIKQPDSDLKYEALAVVCIENLLKNAGVMENRIKKFIKEETFLIEHYKKIASSPSWLKRFAAVEKLGFFMMDDLREFFTEILNTDQSPEVRAKAVWALSLIADEKALGIIIEKLSSGISKSSKFNEYVFTNVIRSFRKRVKAHILITLINDIRRDQTILSLIKRDLIDACGSSGFYEAEKTINDYFTDYSSEALMKIACIRALGRIADSGVCETILTGLGDKDWRVRAVSARAASICPDYASRPQLLRLLYDSVFFVRINTAKTLGQLGDNGLSALKKEINSQDRFVRDTVRYILEEKGLHA